MSDLIDRQQAIELLLKWADGYSYIETPTDAAVEAFRKLPSAEPDVLDTNVEDTISRKAAIEAFQKELCREREYAIGFSGIERILNALPSAQPVRKVELDGAETQIEILSALRTQFNCFDEAEEPVYRALSDAICALSAQPESDKRLGKIAELVEGTIDHFDKDDAMDLLYQIKEVINERP